MEKNTLNGRFPMDEILKLLDKNIDYVSHAVIDDTIHINAISNTKYAKCPYCNTFSSKIHAYYEKSFQDLPIQAKKVIIILRNRKMLCQNPDCSTKTFAEVFDFIRPKSKKTNRLDNEIINLSINTSSIVATQFIKSNIANISRSTVCNVLKKSQNLN